MNKYASIPIILNAANEIFVDEFLKNNISFYSIISNLFELLRDKNLAKYAIKSPSNYKSILDIDEWVRRQAIKIAKKENKMKKFFIILTFLVISNVSLAEIIKDIKINGNERISDETVKVYGDIQINQDVNNFKINEIIKNLYSTNFFKDIKVVVKDKTLIIDLIEYPVINEVIVVGEKTKKYQDAIKENIKSKKNGPFIKSFVSEDEIKIKRLYSTLGFNFVDVELKLRPSPKIE